MTKDEIIKLAKECGYWSGQTVELNDVGLRRFAALVSAVERERAEKAEAELAALKEALTDHLLQEQP